MLEGIKVTKYFGGLAAVKDFDFTVGEREIVGLIGPNGSGKTTLFNCISGYYRLTSGSLKFNGQDLSHLKTYEICRSGIGRTHQIVRPFQNMTSLENIMIGAIYGRRERISLEEANKDSLSLLEFVGLKEKEGDLASTLNLHERKMIEVARALATKPEIILVDEALAGLTQTESDEIMKVLRRIRDDLKITVFLVEHVMRVVMGLADHIMVIHHGEKIAEGTPKEIASNEIVIDAYLGEKYAV